jgi:hypothetical protein
MKLWLMIGRAQSILQAWEGGRGARDSPAKREQSQHRDICHRCGLLPIDTKSRFGLSSDDVCTVRLAGSGGHGRQASGRLSE